MLRKRKTRLYKEETNDDEADGDKRGFSLMEQIKLNRSNDRDNKQKYLLQLTGDKVNLELVQKQGFDKPILVDKHDGLDIVVPAKNFSVRDVRNHVGHDRIIDVMDVETQKNIEMTMKEFCEYYESKHKDRLWNVISLEFSHTDLDELVKAPKIVRLLDWVDQVWPKFLKDSQTESTNSIDKMKYPKVQKYCLMSVKGSYTDFHIDFGGTSVWYHILKGKKIFWMIPPTEFNLQTFEDWTLSGMQQHVFFGDTVEECFRVELSAGQTFFIPSGWIHAVYTLEDSLVFGGNFLHSYGIERQLKVASIEDATKVPVKFRYPFYTEILWYVIQHYVNCLSQQEDQKSKDEDEDQTSSKSSSPKASKKTSDAVTKVTNNNASHYTWSNPKDEVQEMKRIHLTSYEIVGLKALIKHLGKLSRTKKNLPTSIRNSRILLDDCKKLLSEHENDDPELAVTGKPITVDMLKSTRMDMNELIGQFFKQENEDSDQVSPNKESMKLSTSPTKKSCATAGTASANSGCLNSSSTPNSTTSTPPPRSKSPPTRPLSKNQYTNNKTKNSCNSNNNNNLFLPGSFADLIAATSTEKKVFEPCGSDSYLQNPLKKRLLESIPASQISPNKSGQKHQQAKQDSNQAHQQAHLHLDKQNEEEKNRLKEEEEQEKNRQEQQRRQQDQMRHIELLRRQKQDRQRHQEQLKRQQEEQQRLQEQHRKQQEQLWLDQQRQQDKLRQEHQRRLDQQRLEHQQRVEQQRQLEKQRYQQEQEKKRQQQLLLAQEKKQQLEEEDQRRLQEQKEHELNRIKEEQRIQQQLKQPVLFNSMQTFSSTHLARPANSVPLLAASMASPLGLPIQSGARIIWATPQGAFASPVGGIPLANQLSANASLKNPAAIASVPAPTAKAKNAVKNIRPTTRDTAGSVIVSQTSVVANQSKITTSSSAIDNAALLSLATTALSTAPMISSPTLSQISHRTAMAPHAIMVSPATAANQQQQQAGVMNTAALLAGQQFLSPFLARSVMPMATHYIARPNAASVANPTMTATTRPAIGQLVFARIPNQAQASATTSLGQQRYLITQPHFMAQRFQQPLGIPNRQPGQTLAFATFKLPPARLNHLNQ